MEARLKALGSRLIPPEPLTREGRALIVEIPAPKLLSSSFTEQQRVEFLANAYRAVLKRRFSINSPYLRSATLALESHPDYPRLVSLSAAMLEENAAPLAWVAFSFDAWSHTPKGVGKSRPPPAKWVWSINRWKKHLAWFKEAAYSGVELRTPPEAKALWLDWRHMWVELMHTAPETRAQLASTVEKWFPGDAYEKRLSRARAQAWEWQTRVDDEVAKGGWPWLAV